MSSRCVLHDAFVKDVGDKIHIIDLKVDYLVKREKEKETQWQAREKRKENRRTARHNFLWVIFTITGLFLTAMGVWASMAK